MTFNHYTHSLHRLSWAKRISTHLPLHATWVATRSARHDAFLKNLSQDSFMEGIPVLRGVLPRSSRPYVGLREQHEGMIACPGLRPLSGRPHASNHGWRSVPSSDRRIPAAPSRASYCASLFGSHANGF